MKFRTSFTNPLSLTALLGLALIAPSLGQDTTISGTAGANDSWNTSSNWDNDVPTGTDDAAIAPGVIAQVNNASTPSYSGTTTIAAGSTLRIVNGSATSYNALGTGGLIMESGSTVDTATSSNATFPQIAINGPVSFLSSQNPADRDTRTFAGVISGEGPITLTGRNVEKWIFTQTNTFTGGITFAAIDRYIVRGQAPGAFGAGDVTVTPRTINPDQRSAALSLEAENVIADTATVSLSGTGGNSTNGFDDFSGNSVLIRVNFAETIGALIVNGSELPAGTYTDASGDWIDGTGSLIVTGDTNQPSESIAITSFDYDPTAGSVSLTWDSAPGFPYLVRYSSDLQDWSRTFATGIDGDAGTQTTRSFLFSEVDAEEGPKLFFRIERVLDAQ